MGRSTAGVEEQPDRIMVGPGLEWSSAPAWHPENAAQLPPGLPACASEPAHVQHVISDQTSDSFPHISHPQSIDGT